MTIHIYITLYIYIVLCRIGCVDVLITDQGREFVNHLNAKMFKRHSIDHRISSAYHPQTNGLVERFNRTLQDALRKVVNTDGTDWDLYIKEVLYGYRSSVHASTGFTPFFVMFGRYLLINSYLYNLVKFPKIIHHY